MQLGYLIEYNPGFTRKGSGTDRSKDFHIQKLNEGQK